MSQTEPGDREEMLLQGILNGDTETNIEPGSRKEMLLKAILENGGGSSLIVTLTATNDGYTGDKSVAEIKSVIDGGGCVYLSYPDGDMRIIAEYTDDTSLRVGVFSEDEYIVYSVVDGGNDGVTLSVEKDNSLRPQTITLSAADEAVIVSLSQQFATAASASQNTVVAVYSATAISVLNDIISACKKGLTQFVSSGTAYTVQSYSDTSVSFRLILNSPISASMKIVGYADIILHSATSIVQGIAAIQST